MYLLSKIEKDHPKSEYKNSVINNPDMLQLVKAAVACPDTTLTYMIN